MIAQFLWTTRGDEALEQAVPVLWHGEHLRRQGWSNPITLCFLQGLELLSPGYRGRLVELGYEIVDCGPRAAALTERYPRGRELSTTSRCWFLRWNVLHELATERGAETVVHLDGDVVLLADPRDVYRDVAGKTFMLQGCPALTVISDPSWFAVWEEELARLLADRPSYVAAAMAEKADPHRPDREFCNLCAYGPEPFEDQDMLEYLVAAGRLPQARTAEVYDSGFYWIQNPLLPGEWHGEQAAGALRRVVERGGIPHVGDKRVAFYHFQNNFAQYCRSWQHFSRIGLGGVAALLRPAGAGRLNSRLAAAGGKVLDLAYRRLSRRAVYEDVFRTNPVTGNRYVTDIVNSCWE
ncbi:MAG: hypothetical protein ED859_02080 [Desulfuromonadales bacterium]|nr:MAG: hypothetical protein ED859_02080 [Desulfuromonadales bacterium]